MIALIIYIVQAIISLTQLKEIKKSKRGTILKRLLIQLVVYPVVLVALFVWVFAVLLPANQVNVLDVPQVLVIISAQETVIDGIVIKVSTRLNSALAKEQDKNFLTEGDEDER